VSDTYAASRDDAPPAFERRARFAVATGCRGGTGRSLTEVPVRAGTGLMAANGPWASRGRRDEMLHGCRNFCAFAATNDQDS
jgi:hypothetical protein